MNKQFVLVWLFKGNKPFPIFTGAVSLCQKKKAELKGQPQFKGGILIVRTVEGFKANPLYRGKDKKSVKNSI